MNPLLGFEGLPDFAAIRPEHVAPAIDELLAAAEAGLEAAIAAEVPPDYDALSATLDVPVERLQASWSAVGHLQAVADTPELRAAYAQALPRVTAFYTRLHSEPRLYAKYKALDAAVARGEKSLRSAQRKALSDALRDFVLGGAELQGAARERHAAAQKRATMQKTIAGDDFIRRGSAHAASRPENAHRFSPLRRRTCFGGA